jgi:molybdate transport system substrate-binding protein
MQLLVEFLSRLLLSWSWIAMRVIKIAAILSVIFPVGCGQKGAPAPLRIAAASDLESVLPSLISKYKLEPGSHQGEIEPVFGSSTKLAQQIRQGGPFDLFLCANLKIVKELEKEGLVQAGSVRAYTRGSLVLALNKKHEGTVASLDDLTKPTVKKIAIANPETAPYGAAAKLALESADLWGALEPKIVFAENVRQALQFAETGNADVAIVGQAMADRPGIIRIPIDKSLYDPPLQGLGIVDQSAQARAAESFAIFLNGHAGQGILRDFGYISPLEKLPSKRSQVVQTND